MTEKPPRHCPVCQKAMKQHVVWQTEVESCEDHGLWLDKGELSRILIKHSHAKKRIRRAAAADRAELGALKEFVMDVFDAWNS